MTFFWPQLLWLLVLPVTWLVWELTRGRKALAASHPKILRAEVGTHDLAVLETPNRTRALRVRPWLMVGLAFAIVALARPQWGKIEEPVFDQAREILLAVDLSRSMLAPDVKPSRIERSKLLIQALLEKLQGERVGLVVFSGTAFLQSPLSSDYEILREFLPALGPDFLPEGGTNYRALIDTSLDAFGAGNAADRFLVILSDGEATDDEWQARVAELKKKGVRVLGLGIGTTGGTMIPDGSGGFVKDARGAVVLSKLESATLQNLASATGGTYRDASTWIDLAALIDETVNQGRKGEFTDKRAAKLVDRFQWPLAFAFWCFLVSFYYEFPVRPRSRDISLRSQIPGNRQGRSGAPATGAAVRLSLLLLSASFLSTARPLHAAKLAPAAKPPAGPASAPPGSALESAQSLGRIVGRLSQKPSLADVDLSEFARETLTWGRRVQESHAQVPPGPVRDALSALDAIEAGGNKMADWAQLRKDLEALLQAPPPPPQPPPQQQQQQQKNNQDQQKQDRTNQDQQKQSPSDQSQPKDQPQDKPANQPPKNQESPKPPPPGETQKVGGAPEKDPAQPPPDPSIAPSMEKLEQLKNQDSPAQLFQMMQSDRSEGTKKKPQKDW